MVGWFKIGNIPAALQEQRRSGVTGLDLAWVSAKDVLSARFDGRPI
jgi:hypothetical protein